MIFKISKDTLITYFLMVSFEEFLSNVLNKYNSQIILSKLRIKKQKQC